MLQQSAHAKFSINLPSKQKNFTKTFLNVIFTSNLAIAKLQPPPLIGMQSHSIRLASVSEELRSQHLEPAINIETSEIYLYQHKDATYMICRFIILYIQLKFVKMFSNLVRAELLGEGNDKRICDSTLKDTPYVLPRWVIFLISHMLSNI